ncbi:RNA polymerase, sigma-24 subunit, ECF subfamily [Chthoniobacter flavus Ellin428]|uniref:RNA polymerase, sigma-24 subunit, ECF subfamily n=1 Tax=Chthoniobacter flavus Ellin428 TaxID=497964 RepID=B4D527_9BACT|nr:RNA polymerase sigma factor [Chthoniobacter flavus]EDY18630.1 RNA polymerase, sigma-24 subunit, ECF subfamily [Chthoniobacter flavus Ellin428]TCO90914.1 RNA polymerase sigma-70 factor (ECF subfamily) [Chthoniobacter flavus]
MKTPVPHSFQTTRWTVVRRAVGNDDAAAQKALSALCEGYWYPIYAFVRRSGKSPHDAEDLTQGFFARLLERDMLATADPTKGKLRTFLLSCARHFLADEHDRANAQKRGAGLISSFDAVQAEERYAIEPVDNLTPDRLFQRRWALALLEQTLETIAAEYAAEGKAELFAALRPFLGFGKGAAKSYEELVAELNLPIGTLKNHVFRMRERWRKLLLDQVAATLDEPTEEEVRAELSELIGCV